MRRLLLLLLLLISVFCSVYVEAALNSGNKKKGGKEDEAQSEESFILLEDLSDRTLVSRFTNPIKLSDVDKMSQEEKKIEKSDRSQNSPGKKHSSRKSHSPSLSGSKSIHRKTTLLEHGHLNDARVRPSKIHIEQQPDRGERSRKRRLTSTPKMTYPLYEPERSRPNTPEKTGDYKGPNNKPSQEKQEAQDSHESDESLSKYFKSSDKDEKSSQHSSPQYKKNMNCDSHPGTNEHDQVDKPNSNEAMFKFVVSELLNLNEISKEYLESQNNGKEKSEILHSEIISLCNTLKQIMQPEHASSADEKQENSGLNEENSGLNEENSGLNEEKVESGTNQEDLKSGLDEEKEKRSGLSEKDENNPNKEDQHESSEEEKKAPSQEEEKKDDSSKEEKNANNPSKEQSPVSTTPSTQKLPVLDKIVGHLLVAIVSIWILQYLEIFDFKALLSQPN